MPQIQIEKELDGEYTFIPEVKAQLDSGKEAVEISVEGRYYRANSDIDLHEIFVDGELVEDPSNSLTELAYDLLQEEADSMEEVGHEPEWYRETSL